MLDAGFLDEVRALGLGPTASTAVGYREMVRVVQGAWDLDMARDRAIDATTALSRRQRTYHRRDPRIEWLEWDDDPAVVAKAAAKRLKEAGWTS
jgi:tRNA dimethylallyltransferase